MFRTKPIHIFLFTIHPIVSLFALNIHEVNLQYIIRPLIIALLIASCVYVFFQLVSSDNHVAPALVSVNIILLLSYGAVFNLVDGLTIGEFLVGRQRIILPVYLVISLFILWIVWKLGRNRNGITIGFNLAALLLVAMPLFQIGVNFRHVFNFTNRNQNNDEPQIFNQSHAQKPDIYYFIPDAYGRADYLKKYMNYDNSWFINELRSLGFFVGDCSLSNYSFTRLSLASSLNMDYLESLPGNFDPNNKDATLLDDLIINSKVRRQLEQAGYQTVAFETGYPFTEMNDGSYYFKPNNDPLTMQVVSPFEKMVIDNTIVKGMKNVPPFKQWIGSNFPYGEKYQRQKFIIDKLRNVPSIPGSKFVFIHLTTTHRPYIFQPDGSILNDENYYINDGVPLDDEHYIRGYQYQLDFTNQYLVDLVKIILAESSVPPIIIIQGDHGVRDPGRLSILNAIYPGENDPLLYSSITPVNTFRYVFNQLGIDSLDFLPDHSYYSNANKSPYKLVEIDGIPTDCKIK